MKSGEMAMTENEAIVFIKNEINVMVLQKNGAFGSPAANIFRTRNGAKRIETLEAIIGLITRLKQYQNIGTVEECREAVEKQKVFCKSAEKYADGKCTGYGKSEMDDEPCEMCKGCNLYSGYEELESGDE